MSLIPPPLILNSEVSSGQLKRGGQSPKAWGDVGTVSGTLPQEAREMSELLIDGSTWKASRGRESRSSPRLAVALLEGPAPPVCRVTLSTPLTLPVQVLGFTQRTHVITLTCRCQERRLWPSWFRDSWRGAAWLRTRVRGRPAVLPPTSQGRVKMLLATSSVPPPQGWLQHGRCRPHTLASGYPPVHPGNPPAGTREEEKCPDPRKRQRHP